VNDTDVICMKSLMDAIDHVGVKGLILLDVKATQFMKVHLLLLRGLLEEKGMRGLFISVDRPHQYVVHLARMHKINIGGLTFIDVICRYSGDRKNEQGNIGLLAGPFNINNLPAAIATWAKSVGSDLLDPQKGGFVIIDNPAALAPYNNCEKVELLLSGLHEMFGGDKNVIVPFITDKEKSENLYEISRPMCVGEVNMMNLMAATVDESKAVGREASNEIKGTGA